MISAVTSYVNTRGEKITSLEFNDVLQLLIVIELAIIIGLIAYKLFKKKKN